MKELIPTTDFGIFVNRQEQILIDSRFVAERFGKEHKSVIRSIENIMANDLIDNFNQHNFVPIEYRDDHNRKQPAYAMTLNGFQLLISTFTGGEMLPRKVIYFNKIDEMKEYLKTYISVRDEFPLITEQINLLHEKPKRYHFSNEFNMLYVIATGYTAKKIRQIHGLDDNAVVRPYLTHEEIELLDKLYKIDVGLLISTPKYRERKAILQQYKDSYLSRHQLIGA